MSQLDPSSFPIIGPGTPYINPRMLIAAPTGISWDTIPDVDATPDQQLAQQTDICAIATAMVDEVCNQPLRATIDVETSYGPGSFRCQNMPNGNTRILLSRFPVVAVLGGRFAAAAGFPRQWQTIPADQYAVETSTIGVYGTTAPGASGTGGQSVLLAPGYVSWFYGRQNCVVETTYLNGWPHASLTEAPNAGDQTLAVDDITGWLGAVGVVYSQAGQEAVFASAVTPSVTGAISGPGTLTLASALSFTHQVGDIVSCLPGSVFESATLFAVIEALTRGATSTAVQSLAGGANSGGGLSPDKLEALARRLVNSYRRTI